MVLSIKKPIILKFWAWYYTSAVKNLFHTWKNFIIFVNQYFSIPLLLKTLFAPWKKDITKYGRGFSIKNFFQTLSFNLISRGVGFFARLFTILLGLISLLGVILLGVLALIIWIVLPFILLFLIITGILLLI